AAAAGRGLSRDGGRGGCARDVRARHRRGDSEPELAAPDGGFGGDVYFARTERHGDRHGPEGEARAGLRRLGRALVSEAGGSGRRRPRLSPLTGARPRAGWGAWVSQRVSCTR